MSIEIRSEHEIDVTENATGTCVILNGTRIESDDLVNPHFLTDGSVNAFRDSFAHALPYKHVVLNGLFSPRLLECVAAEFDAVKPADWERYDNRNERKLGTKPQARLGHAAQLYFDTIYSKHFVDFIARVSGIDGLVTDPMLHGGGLHKIPTSGRFAIHVDFSKHPVTKLDNRLVFITYLNREWKSEYGGVLELWDVDRDRCAAKIVPVIGRSVLLYQSAKSAHGHPDPVRGPQGRERRSIAAYFYSNGRADEPNHRDHSTIIVKPITMGRYGRLALGMKYWTSPALVDALRRLRRRL